jgi:5-methylcytosine-specific restriction enzyme A
MSKLRSLPFLLAQVDTRTTKLSPKIKDPFYDTPAFRYWRTLVVARAGGRCEVMVDGYRCTRATPHHRMYADHIIELRDGGAPLDLNNGQCLCRSHHEIKTVEARRQRLQMVGGDSKF